VWIAEQVRTKRVSISQISTDDGLRLRVWSLTRLHLAFLVQCRAVGLTVADYPFSTEHMGIRSLAAAVRAECVRTFERGATLAGASHMKGLPSQAGGVPAASQACDVVEFDGHRLDVRLKVVVRDPLGFEQGFEIERIWLLVIIDVWSRAVLGYHVSLNHEYSRYDVIRTIENALAPHRPRRFTLPGLGNGVAGGFPSGKLTELGYATWQWFKLDNAKANLAGDVQYALAGFMGCFIDAGPAHSPDDRPYIERFFGTVASSLSSRLPGYTGSNTRDVRRALADPKGNLNRYPFDGRHEARRALSTDGRFGRLRRTGTGRRWVTRCPSLPRRLRPCVGLGAPASLVLRYGSNHWRVRRYRRFPRAQCLHEAGHR
jgi:putative transposase